MRLHDKLLGLLCVGLGALLERGAHIGRADNVGQLSLGKLLEELLEGSLIRGGSLSGKRIGGQDETGSGQKCKADYGFHIGKFWLDLRQNGANWIFILLKMLK
mgnify:CR=1 FL=1